MTVVLVGRPREGPEAPPRPAAWIVHARRKTRSYLSTVATIMHRIFRLECRNPRRHGPERARPLRGIRFNQS